MDGRPRVSWPRPNCRPGWLASLLIGLAAIPAAASAQITLDASIGSALQSLHEAGSAATQGQGTLTGGGEVGVDFATEKGRVSYALERGAYAQRGDWSFLQHRLAGRYRFDLGPRWRLHAGAETTLRRNGAEWSFADYDAAGIFVNLEGRPVDGMTLRSGYHLDARSFPTIPSLDQTEKGAFASLLLNLPSRTSLIAEARAGMKAYAGEAMPLAEPIEAQSSTVGAVGQSRGGGRGMGPSLRPTLVTITTASAPAGASADPSWGGESARQITVLGRIAQSLSDRTGLSFQASWRITSGQVTPAVVGTPAGFFDDGVYDDPFASDLKSLQVRLRHERPDGSRVELSGRRFTQSFVSALALDATGVPLDGVSLREDRVWRAMATASLPLLSSRTGSLGMTFDVGYVFTHSASNDAEYTYDSHTAAAAVSVRY